MAGSQLQQTLKEKYRVESKLFYETFFASLGATREELGQRLRKAKDNPEFVGFLEDEAATFNAFVADASQLLLVSIYHWIERSLKNVLNHCDHGAKRPAPQHPANMGALRTALATYGVRLDLMPSFDDAETLRAFANSWKHDTGLASPQLLQRLGLTEKRVRLSDYAIEAALRKAGGLNASSDEEKLVLTFRERALAFLYAVADAAPIEFPTERRRATLPLP